MDKRITAGMISVGVEAPGFRAGDFHFAGRQSGWIIYSRIPDNTSANVRLSQC
jgi:hypothetical protein